jgi:NAD(P)H-nitrite reductase large subunit
MPNKKGGAGAGSGAPSTPKRKDILDKGAIVQRDGETYAVTPRIPCGLITDFSLLRRMADAAERFGASAMKVTSSQRIAIIGVKEEDLDAIWSELGMTPGFAFGLCIRSIKACPGTTHCRMGQQDALGLGLRIEDRYVNQPAPNKLKISVSGCPMDCAEAHVRDIGLIGSRKGYALELGGSVGPSPRLGQVAAEDLSAEEAEALVGRVITVYCELGIKKRLGKVLDQVGFDAFRDKL